MLRGQLGFSVTNLGTYPTTLSRVKIVQYFVDEQNKLVRRVFGVKGSGFIDNIVAEHLKDFTIPICFETRRDEQYSGTPEGTD